jgi:hypothetical protein
VSTNLEKVEDAERCLDVDRGFVSSVQCSGSERATCGQKELVGDRWRSELHSSLIRVWKVPSIEGRTHLCSFSSKLLASSAARRRKCNTYLRCRPRSQMRDALASVLGSSAPAVSQ